MKYDFDELVDRRGTNSLKWDYSERFTGRSDLLPLWVADMDFRAPEFITRALTERIVGGVFGYAQYPPSYFEAVQGWLSRRHQWEIDTEWIVPVPGVVPAIRLAIDAYTKPGDKIVIQPPVYHPFRAVIAHNGRQVVENPLKREDGRYRMDCEQLEEVVDDETRAVLLCSPHNPVGRVWSEEELRSLIAVCRKHDLLIISDEIHLDLVMSGSRHLPTAKLADARQDKIVTLTSATKSFNLSGMSCANAIIADPVTRRSFARQVINDALQIPNLMSVVAAEAAYRHGEEWLDQALAYIEGHYRYLKEFIGTRAPQLTVYPLEGTYLVWIDLSSTGLDDDQIKERILNEGLWLDDGPIFGGGGESFQRINIACPRTILEDALQRLLKAIG